MDWVAQGMVSKVKNQGQCGSSWAFAATGAMESKYLMKGESVLLSEQQVLDCSKPYGNYGCNGGWMNATFAYTKDHGLQTDQQYPYVARDQKCSAPEGGKYKISEYVSVSGCAEMEEALNSQPIATAADAMNWSLYKSGIFSNCGNNASHGVLAVGVNNQEGYWLIKNTWGESWGENGYIRLAKGSGNACGICSYPSYPIL